MIRDDGVGRAISTAAALAITAALALFAALLLGLVAALAQAAEEATWLTPDPWLVTSIAASRAIAALLLVLAPVSAVAAFVYALVTGRLDSANATAADNRSDDGPARRPGEGHRYCA